MPSALIALLTLDVAASKDEKALREAWRRMLAGANLLQFLPCAVALTAEGSASGVYEQAGWARLHPASGPTLGTGSPLWQAAMDASRWTKVLLSVSLWMENQTLMGTNAPENILRAIWYPNLLIQMTSS